jgi:heme-degrading monooxygenase HmoA
MITRIWHGRTNAEDADRYLEYIQATGLAEYAATSGNISAKILRKIEGNICHFFTISEWENIDSIIKFAGDDFEKAKYYDEDKNYLLELEEKVNHYETYYS